MLTKGDILAHLGLASGPTGTFEEKHGLDEHKTKSTQKAEKIEPPLDGPVIRRLIVSNMLAASTRARSAPGKIPCYIFIVNRKSDSRIIAFDGTPDFDSIIADYLPSVPQPLTYQDSSTPLMSPQPDYFEGLL